MNTLKNSATFVINEHSKKLEQSGRKIYKFGFGQSPFPVPEYAVKALKENASRKDYTDPQGLLELREKVSEHYKSIYNLDILPENVVISSGSKPLLFFTQLVLKDYDLILPRASWVSYEPQAAVLEKTVHWVETSFDNEWKLEPSKLRELFERVGEKKLLILNYPNNPSGKTYSKEELSEIAKVLKEYKSLVLADEIYSELNFSGNHSSIMEAYPEGTIITSGLSKWAGAGGWRLGYAVTSPELSWLTSSLVSVLSECLSSAATPVQVAATQLLKEESKNQEYLKSCRKLLSEIAKFVHTELSEAGVKCSLPEGGFYTFCDFEFFRKKLAARNINTSEELCVFLLEEAGAALLSGNNFGCESGKLLTRLSFVNFDGGKAVAAMDGSKLNQEFLEEYCFDTFEGVREVVRVLKEL